MANFAKSDIPYFVHSWMGDKNQIEMHDFAEEVEVTDIHPS